jgi:hypothetical protein
MATGEKLQLIALFIIWCFVVRLIAELNPRLQASEQLPTSELRLTVVPASEVPATEPIRTPAEAFDPTNETGLAQSWELYWRALLEDEQIFWQILVNQVHGLINALILVMILWYRHKVDERKQNLMDERIDRLYNETVFIVQQIKAMKAEGEKMLKAMKT